MIVGEQELYPKRLELIFSTLRRRVPRIESVLAESMPDGRLCCRSRMRLSANRFSPVSLRT
ncbi:hypothetical protein, partial [Acetomicrobium sp. S15 = DSM 107314]|uniref:hypothetical protein n=1 Tax=Acetomicrobium sp. S15 = DSM 107314 TaxID=2529858 RepID=UPI001E5437D8